MSEQHRVAIVTGSASGIGAATAIELARRGWRVVVNYANSAAGAQQGVDQCVQAGITQWGRLDALVNNAGTTKFVAHANLDGLSAEDFQLIYATNVIGPFQMTRAAASALKDSGRGAVVNVSSVAALLGTGSSIAYAASKGALNTMTRSLARVLGPTVRVNAVSPGFVDTPWMVAGHGGPEKYKQRAEHYSSLVPLKNTCLPADVADTIVWLIEGAPKTTGDNIYIDAGMHMAQAK